MKFPGPTRQTRQLPHRTTADRFALVSRHYVPWAASAFPALFSTNASQIDIPIYDLTPREDPYCADENPCRSAGPAWG